LLSLSSSRQLRLFSAEPASKASEPITPVPEQPSPPPSPPSSWWTVGDVVLGALLGASLYNLADVVFSFPEPGPTVVRLAEKEPRVLEVLGAPLSRGFDWKGTVQDDFADLLIPVSGPKASGFLHAKAVFADNQWIYMLLLAELPENEVIDMSKLGNNMQTVDSKLSNASKIV
jgi:hypothetical protein